jgi:hypothetical protein
MRQERAGLLCKHIIAAKLDAGLDAQEEQAVARLKDRRSLALLNGDDEQYDTLTTELGAA